MVFELDTSKEIEQVIEQNKKEKTVDNTETIKEKIVSEKIDVDLEKIKDPEPRKSIIDINDESYLDEYLEKKPVKNNEEKDEIEFDNIEENKSIDELKTGYIQEESETTEQFDIEDFEMASDFTIEALEVGTSSLFRWYAMDTSDINYEMTTKKKSKLKKLLTKILIRYSVKFPLIWLFLITLVLTHAQPFMNAKENRKKVLAENKKKTKRISVKSKAKSEDPVESKNVGKKPFSGIKKPRGGQHK